MKLFTQKTLAIILIATITACTGQPQPANQNNASVKTKTNEIVGGGCDGCELMYVGMPAAINAVDTSVGWAEKGQKLLVTGKVFMRDGQTPANNVIIYYWHTDNNGYYSPSDTMNVQAKRHGHIRGWVKTGSDGRYSIYTIRPAPYPNENIPAHIHTSIKEATINEYYIDEFVFDNDPLLTEAKRKALENRGGSGILITNTTNGLQTANHDIILGLNIPSYPESR